MVNSMVLFGLSGSRKMAKSIADHLKIELGEIETLKFSDGEILVKPKITVRNREVFVIQSISSPCNDKWMELFIFIDALKRASAAFINVIIPYYGYARQDRKSKGREPITAKLMADFLEKSGANKVILIDIHTDQIQGFFDISVDTLKATTFLLQEVFKKHKLKNAVIVSPDYGGVKNARTIAQNLEVPLAIIDKRRPEPNKVEVANILGDIKGKECILIDDMIDTGNTILAACDLLYKNGAKSIVVMATHGVFSNNAIERFKQAIDKEIISDLYITDSIEYNLLINHPKIKIVSIAPFFAKVIDAQIKGKSISDIYEKEWKKTKLCR